MRELPNSSQCSVVGFLTLTLVFWITTVSSAVATTLPDPALLYSADKVLCPDLTTRLSSLHKHYAKAAYLSDLQEEFRADGRFSSAPWMTTLNDKDREFFLSQKVSPASAVAPFTSRDERESLPDADALIALAESASSKTIVRVKNWALGDHGDYQTEVFLLKKNQPFLALSESKSISATPEEKQLDFDRGSIETVINPALSGLHFSSEPTANDKTIRAVELLKGSSNPQFPFGYHGHLYVIAGEALRGTSLVYELQPGLGAQVVCVERIEH